MRRRSIIKWAATTLAQVQGNPGSPSTQQVSYMGKAAKVSTWTPYGLANSPPASKLTLLLSILMNSDNQVGLVGSPGEDPTLAETEVALFHPPTGSKVHFLANGDISMVAGTASILLTAAGGITITPGTSPVTVAGDLVVTGDLTATAGSTALGSVVTSGAKDISDTHTHGGSATAPTGAISPTGVPV